MVSLRPAARVPAVLFAVIGIVHLVAQWSDPARGGGPVAGITQWLLMPALAAAFAVAVTPAGFRDRLVRWVAAALGFSWLGDAAPDLASADTAFVIKVGFFLVAQVCYIVACWPFRSRSVLADRRWLLAGYVAAIAALIVFCAPHAGSLLVPVLVYGALLGTMAVLATGINLLTAVGGAMFLVSDGLIALQQFVPGLEIPRGGFWVMATYIAAQSLIVLGVLRQHRAGPPAGSQAAPAGSAAPPTRPDSVSPDAAAPRAPRRRTGG